MQVFTIFVLTVFFSLLVVFFFATRFVLFSSHYFDKHHPDYERLSMGNPLNAIFFSQLLTDEGMRQRALIGKILGAIWLAFVPITLIAQWLSPPS